MALRKLHRKGEEDLHDRHLRGSELSQEVQFIREFRDKNQLKTFAGKNLMSFFNAWP